MKLLKKTLQFCQVFQYLSQYFDQQVKNAQTTLPRYDWLHPRTHDRLHEASVMLCSSFVEHANEIAPVFAYGNLLLFDRLLIPQFVSQKNGIVACYYSLNFLVFRFLHFLSSNFSIASLPVLLPSPVNYYIRFHVCFHECFFLFQNRRIVDRIVWKHL